jgi:hypothetical protein
MEKQKPHTHRHMHVYTCVPEKPRFTRSETGTGTAMPFFEIRVHKAKDGHQGASHIGFYICEKYIKIKKQN